MKPVSEFWQFRKRSFIWHTVIYGVVCVTAGWGLHVEFLRYTSVLYFIPSIIAAIMLLYKLWQTAFQERR